MSRFLPMRRLRNTFLALLALATPSTLAASPKPTHPGCFLLMDLETGKVSRNDAKKCATRMPPASTFKVPHALIALETGVITSVDQVHPWDGTQRRVAMWNQDQTLDTAMRRSAVWVFQETARKIGRERMEDWLERFHYGT
ncbi:penicillin-binding transpeptidase domain-containing protein [Myxococcus landrumensis]|uniref:Beta-lactamase n=1 Tax=Myxococcus landrumensis TaxID=2813577 RepID=A0ABX7N5E9_9BACT|nr:penicillin-binding transpeptidase domain-containing protein [Myxococcus landrumus]QSQ12880.1 hypothetical protein JY572_31700 [Myxococcus landrumus]